MNLVKLFIELVELCGFRHYVLVHEERGLDLLVTLFTQKVETVGDQGLVEVDTIVCEEIATVAGDFCTCTWIIECWGRKWRRRKEYLDQDPLHLTEGGLHDERGFRIVSQRLHLDRPDAMFEGLDYRPGIRDEDSRKNAGR